MDYDQLLVDLGNLGATVNNNFRASLYINYLQQTHTFLQTTLDADASPGIGAAAYEFCAPALRSTKLLTELATVLDFYVSPAVESDMLRVFATPAGGNYTYADYFNNTILNADGPTYQTNLDAFRTRIPISASALSQATTNFQNNIATACERIYGDIDRIQQMYSDQYGPDFKLLNLKQIKSTGSDFHKGGKQVLILTFACSYLIALHDDFTVASTDLKLVYKPSDLEADCLLAGDSATVNRVLGHNFMTNSLFEIYNQQLSAYKTATPAFGGKPLTTYKILPIFYLSAVPGTLPADLRKAYGYLEYLSYDVQGTSSQFYGYFPFASSDFIIFPSEDQSQIVSDYYRTAGAMTALSANFSMVDLHIENMRVQRRMPFFIDMEICLTKSITSVTQTLLLDRLGGITGVNVNAQDYKWVAKDTDSQGGAYLERKFYDRFYQNRLWRGTSDLPDDDPTDDDFTNGSRRMIAVDNASLLTGFDDGITILRAGIDNHAFDAWFARLSNVVVRYLPYATAFFQQISASIYVQAPQYPEADRAADEVIEAQVRTFLTAEYNNYKTTADPTADPRFVVLNPIDAGADYQKLDIPVFYHQIGTQDIVNSHGVTVTIPPQMKIDQGDDNTQQVDVAPPSPPGVISRTTYFGNHPTTDIVETGQVNALVGATSAQRVGELRSSITNCFGQNAVNIAGTFVPIGKPG